MNNDPVEDKAADGNSGGYTAVVYAHGMGSQRRFQETGRLLDALDTYQHRAFHDRNEVLGRLLGIKAKEETWRTEVAAANDVSGQVPFVQVIYKADSSDPGQEVRFYEIYWADLMDEAGVGEILKWIGMQALRPFRWWKASWRSFHRQRRAVLAEIYEAELAQNDAKRVGDMGKLLELYDGFDGLEAKRKYPKGDFESFLSYVGDRNPGHPQRTERFVALAQAWRKAERAAELSNAIGVLSLIVAILVTFAGLMWSIAQVLGWLRKSLDDLLGGSEQEGLLSLLPEPTYAVVPGIAVSLVLAVGLRRFLGRSLGDVAAWTTYAEAETGYRQRKAVLEAGRSVLQQVLLDKTCKRVVVVGHSLGTSVACDTVLSLARANRTRASSPDQEPLRVPLGSISHLVTLASPIDKISYFFEMHVSSHRFARVLESLRGDLGDAPFTAEPGNSAIRWINFWDEADPISGPLHSPVSRESLEPRIENVHVPSLAFPLPGKAHSAYFENRTVIAALFDIIFRPAEVPEKPEFGESPFGPGTAKGEAGNTYALTLLVPWLGLVALVSYLLNATNLFVSSAGSACVLALVLVVTFILRRKGRRDPL